MDQMHSHPDGPTAESPRDTLSDKRVRPRGVLPRHLQTWLMLGVAATMLLIIVVTGRPRLPRKSAEAGAPAPSTSLTPDRLRRYQEQLAEQEARLRQELAATQAAGTATQQPSVSPEVNPAPADPLADEQRRRQYGSLFADNVAFSRRAGERSAGTAGHPIRAGTDGDLSDLTEVVRGISRATARPPATAPDLRADSSRAAATQPTGPPPALATAPESAVAPTPSCAPATGRNRACLLEGTVIEAVLTNRLDGSLAAPVNALVTSPVYSADRQRIVIPSGARVLGSASPVQAFGESRLAVRFHRLIMPNGTTYSLNQFTGLNQRGDAGLRDQIDRHYLQLFGASLAIGSLSGLAQYSTRSGASETYAFSDAYGQGLGGSLASSAGRILDRFLNVLPTVTIREGHRLKIYLTSDLELPVYPQETIR